MATANNNTTGPMDEKVHDSPATSSVDGNGTTVDDNNEKNVAATPASDATKNEDVEKNVVEKQYERSRGKIALIMLALGLAVFLAALDITIITTALPTISEYFDTSAGYTWIGSAYLLATAASTPIWGKVSDIFGRKPILLVANVVFFVGSLIAALSINIGMLITARAIQGIGGGGLVSLTNICIGDLFSPRRRGAYYGMIGGVWAVASSLGPIIGGAFSEKVTWRWCFYINLPLDGLAFVILLFFLDLKTPTTPIIQGLQTIDWLGCLLVVGGTLMFLFGLELGGVSYPWGSATVVCLLVFGIFTFGLFVLNETYLAKYPVMPSRIFRVRSNLASLGACFIQSFVFIGGSYYLPLYFQAAIGATPILSGVYVLATSLSLSFASIATGIFIRKTGKYMPPIYVGMVLMTLGFGLFIDFRSNSSWAKIFLFQIVAGLGVGPNFQAPLIALQSGINPRDIATATATFGFTRNLATAISVVIGGVIFQNELAKRAAGIPVLAAGGGAGGPGASIGVVDSLPPMQQMEARAAFGLALYPIWILYTAFGVLGILVAMTIGTRKLSTEHQETKTGLEAQAETKAEMDREKEERAAKRASKRMSGRKSMDPTRKSMDPARKSVDPAAGESTAQATQKEVHVEEA